jgi:hypothetical protein
MTTGLVKMPAFHLIWKEAGSTELAIRNAQ